jgi:HEAT repeat protein
VLGVLARSGSAHLTQIRERLDEAGEDLAPVLIAALSRSNSPAADATLASALASSNVAVRRAAAAALVARRLPAAMDAIARVAKEDPDSEVRNICALALHSS